jgi:hypothetical protein
MEGRWHDTLAGKPDTVSVVPVVGSVRPTACRSRRNTGFHFAARTVLSRCLPDSQGPFFR